MFIPLVGDAVGSIFLAPAVSPWETTLPGVIGGTGNNPGVRLVKYDRDTGATLDVIQYYLNLTQANIDNDAAWTIAYTGTEYYNVPDMSTESLVEIADQLMQDDELFDKYYLANGLLYDPEDECVGECRIVQYCAITNLDYELYETCVESLLDNDTDQPSSAGCATLHRLVWLLLICIYCFMFQQRLVS